MTDVAATEVLRVSYIFLYLVIYVYLNCYCLVSCEGKLKGDIIETLKQVMLHIVLYYVVCYSVILCVVCYNVMLYVVWHILVIRIYIRFNWVQVGYPFCIAYILDEEIVSL